MDLDYYLICDANQEYIRLEAALFTGTTSFTDRAGDNPLRLDTEKPEGYALAETDEQFETLRDLADKVDRSLAIFIHALKPNTDKDRRKEALQLLLDTHKEMQSFLTKEYGYRNYQMETFFHRDPYDDF